MEIRYWKQMPEERAWGMSYLYKYELKGGPYAIRDTHIKIREWCLEKFGEHNGIRCNVSGGRIGFNNKQDATLFLMRWSGVAEYEVRE